MVRFCFWGMVKLLFNQVILITLFHRPSYVYDDIKETKGFAKRILHAAVNI